MRPAPCTKCGSRYGITPAGSCPACGQDLTVDVREFARRLMDAPYVSSGQPAQFMPIRRVRVVG